MTHVGYHNNFHRALLAAVAVTAIAIPQGLAATVIDITFNIANFSDPLTIDNELLPMVPNTTQTYKARRSRRLRSGRGYGDQ